MQAWNEPITGLTGVGAAREKALEKLGIRTLGDLVMLFPKGYCDIAGGGGLAGARQGALTGALVRVVNSPATVTIRPGMTLTRCDVTEGGKRAQCVWYNQPWTAQKLHPGEDALILGRADFYAGRLRLTNPDAEPYTGQEFPPVIPIYPMTQGLSQKVLRNLMSQALRRVVGTLPDLLPENFRREYALCERNYAIENAHFPASMEAMRAARDRLALEEMLLFSLALEERRSMRSGEAHAIPADPGVREAVKGQLAFSLTEAQERVLDEILHDMESTVPMNRMVQGDVGSGKTVVALTALAAVVMRGYQGALMAPTEILAVQLYEEAQKLLEPLGIRVGLLRGGMKAREKREALAAVADGSWDIAVGTHALIQDGVEFKNLALVVEDEQHRFGVRQRKALAGKAVSPHVLVMSATPVPRSLALILYGDLELSVVNGMPPGRRPVKTSLVPESKRGDMWAYVAREALEGRQTYVVCPAIDDSEGLPIRSASSLYKELTAGPLKDTPTALIHGRLASAEKERILEEFRTGVVRVLISTTVIEVGISVPRATVMVIMNAERFGLAQLHQLRGRVGRSTLESYCFLVSDEPGETAKERLGILTASHDGYAVAEKDLEIRGPGEFLGTRQAGAMDPRLMQLMRDPALLGRIRELTEKIERGELPAEEARALREAAVKRYEALFREIILN